MFGYSAKKQENKLFDIKKENIAMGSTYQPDEYQVNKKGDYFYFTDGANNALYKAIQQLDDGAIVVKEYSQPILNAFIEAIMLESSESIIIPPAAAIEQPVTLETQEQIKDLVAEKIVIQPTIVPIQTQDNQPIIVWASATVEPSFEEEITYAENWTRKNIALPIEAKGVKVYNDNIPEGEVRPREYVVITVDDEVRDVYFSDNKSRKEESLVNILVQGKGNTFENWVVEISRYIHSLLRVFRKNGEVQNIVNRNIGFDETTKTLSRNISFWLQYNS